MATVGLKHFTGEVVEEKFLTCSICLEKYKTPKLLPCMHTFCLKCLENHMERSAQNGSFPCPNCRQPTDVPNNTDTGFKTNFFMNSLLDFFSNAGHTCSFCLSTGKTEKAVSKCIDCSDYLCEKCTGVHGMTRQTVKHKVISIDQLVRGRVDEETSAKAGFPCSEHPEENVRYYCTVCEKPVCRDCKALDHHQHHCITFQEAAKERRPRMNQSLAFLQDQLESAEKLKVSAEKVMENGKTFSERHVQEIEDIYTEAVKYLMSLKTQAINQIEEHSAKFHKEMTSKVEEADMHRAQLKSFQEYLTNVLNVGTNVEIVETYSLARKQNLCPEQTPEMQSRLAWHGISEEEDFLIDEEDFLIDEEDFQDPPYSLYQETRSQYFSTWKKRFHNLAIQPNSYEHEFGFPRVRGPKIGTSTTFWHLTSTIQTILSDFMIACVNYMSTKQEEVINKDFVNPKPGKTNRKYSRIKACRGSSHT